MTWILTTAIIWLGIGAYEFLAWDLRRRFPLPRVKHDGYLAIAEREVEALLDEWTNGPKKPPTKAELEQAKANQRAALAQARLMQNDIHRHPLLDRGGFFLKEMQQQNIAQLARLEQAQIAQARGWTTNAGQVNANARDFDENTNGMVMWRNRRIPREELENMEAIMRAQPGPRFKA